MAADMRLVKKGKIEPRAGLAQEGKVHVGLAKQHAAELEEHGWTTDDTTAFEKNVAMIDSTIAEQAEGRLEASDASAGESSGIDNAKAFLRRLRNGLPRAIREAGLPGVTKESFEAGKTLGRSTPKISTYLTEIRPAVVALDDKLKRFFGGKIASEELDAAKKSLDEADTTQELALKDLPVQTLAIYEAKGRVLEGIEDINRAGKSAFDGQSVLAAKFNKDILLRARQERAKKEEPPAGEGEHRGDEKT